MLVSPVLLKFCQRKMRQAAQAESQFYHFSVIPRTMSGSLPVDLMTTGIPVMFNQQLSAKG
jgi:hypothetical protein